MAVQQPRGFHPWHDIPTGCQPPHGRASAVMDGRARLVGDPNLLTRQGARLQPELSTFTDQAAPQAHGPLRYSTVLP